MLSQQIIVDVGTNEADKIHYVQGEKGRVIEFSFINSLLVEEEVNIAGYTITIHILKSDGNFTIERLNIDSQTNTAFYVLTENDCVVGGCGIYDLSLSKDNEVIYTAHGVYVGDYRSISDDAVNSVSTAYGVTFPEGFQEKLIAGDKIHISENNVISADGEIYTAGDNINISEDNVISAVDTTYSAGANVTITPQNVINVTVPPTYEKTLLFDCEGTPTLNPIDLSDSVLNYDAIYTEVMFNGEALTGNITLKETLLTSLGSLYVGLVAFANTYVGIHKNSTATHFIPYGGNTNGVTRIYGITF